MATAGFLPGPTIDYGATPSRPRPRQAQTHSHPRAHRGYSTVDSSIGGGRATAMCTASWEAAASSTSSARAPPRPPPAAAPPPQFRGNRERVARDAERERLILEWELGMRSLRTHNPVWAAAQPAALSAPLYHAFTIPGEPYGLGESSLRAFLRCLTWSADI